MPRVEFHGFTKAATSDPVDVNKTAGRSTINGWMDVTNFVRSVRWRQSVTRPWESITLQLAVPRRYWFQFFPGLTQGLRSHGAPGECDDPKTAYLRQPTAGFWVVVRMPRGTASDAAGGAAEAWGHVTSLSYGITMGPDGMPNEMTVSIQTESWLEMLGRSRLALKIGSEGFTLRGFLEPLGKWLQDWTGILQGALSEKYPGRLLAKTFKRLAQIQVPETLVKNLTFGGDPRDENAAGAIKIIATESDAEKWAPIRAPQQSEPRGWDINVAGSALPRCSILEYLYSIVGADPNIVEFFPSLEYQPAVDPCTEAGAKPAAWPDPMIRALGGSCPVLIHRIRPFLVDNIDSANATIARSHGNTEIPSAGLEKTASEQLGIYQSSGPSRRIRRAHDKSRDWYTVRENEVISLNPTWSDLNRVNYVTCKPGSMMLPALQMEGVLGVPVGAPAEWRAHGMRPYDVDWPWFPAIIENNEDELADLTKEILSLSELGFALLAGQEAYSTGSMRMRFRPWMKAGHWMFAHLDRLDTTSYKSDGVSSGENWPRFDCYIEAITHEVSVLSVLGGLFQNDDSEIIATTTVEFSRGAFDMPVYPRAAAWRNEGEIQGAIDKAAKAYKETGQVGDEEGGEEATGKTAALNAKYGDPLGGKPAVHGAGDLIEPDAAWYAANIITKSFDVSGKSYKITLHKDVIDDFIARFKQACLATGYRPTSIVGYRSRYKRVAGGGSSSELSLHTWGVAVDIDSYRNGRASTKDAALAKSFMHTKYKDFPSYFKASLGATGAWFWGGDWNDKTLPGGEVKSNCDPMHFQKNP